MLVNILQTFDDANGTRRFAGSNPDVDPAIARKWIADGFASLDLDRAQGNEHPEMSLCAYTWQEIQPKHDLLKSLGGGTLHLVPNATYTVPASAANAGNAQTNSVGYTPVGAFNIDEAYVSFEGNRAIVDISALGNGKVGFHLYSSQLLHDATKNIFNRTFGNFMIVGGDYSTAWSTTTGPTAILCHSDPGADDGTYGVTNTSVRVQIERMNIQSCLKGIAFRSSSYCVRVRDSHIVRNRFGAFNESNQYDYAEKNVFEDVVFAENYAHIYDNTSPVRPQVWTTANCQFDYHQGYLFYLNGAKVYWSSSHGEWGYGESAGQTNCPITLTGSNAGVWMRGGTLAYTGAGQNPNYEATFQADNGAQFLDIVLDKAFQMGRVGNTTSYDAWVTCVGGTSGSFKFRVDPDGPLVTDVPAMTYMSDNGQGGMMRHGIQFPYSSELAHRIMTTGSAVVSQVSATENGVTQKASQPMVKIVGAGKVFISLPIFEPRRRHAWEFFTATSTSTSVFAGTVTIKERREGLAIRLDGSVAPNTSPGGALVTDPRGVDYSGAGVSITTANATWTRRSWKDCNSVFLPDARMNMSNVLVIEIDTTAMSAGAIYLSHFGFDLI